jgi:hypothetical protein
MRKLVGFMDCHSDIDAILCGGEVWRIEDNKPVFSVSDRFSPPWGPGNARVQFSITPAIGLGLIV